MTWKPSADRTRTVASLVRAKKTRATQPCRSPTVPRAGPALALAGVCSGSRPQAADIFTSGVSRIMAARRRAVAPPPGGAEPAFLFRRIPVKERQLRRLGAGGGRVRPRDPGAPAPAGAGTATMGSVPDPRAAPPVPA